MQYLKCIEMKFYLKVVGINDCMVTLMIDRFFVLVKKWLSHIILWLHCTSYVSHT